MDLPAPRLIALDLDGTLITPDNRVPPAHRGALAELEQQGVAVAIVTGRPVLSTRPIHRDLALHGPVVCFNGVWAGDPNGSAIHTDMLDADEVAGILPELVRRERGSISLYPDIDHWVMDQLCPITAGWQQLYGVPIHLDPALRNGWQASSCKILYADDPEQIAELCPALQARYAERYHITTSQNDRLEITRHGATKDRGLAALAAHLGIAREVVWAVGDGANDIEMLRWAGAGLAMGHAAPAVRAAAQYVLPGIDAAGLQQLPELVTAARRA